MNIEVGQDVFVSVFNRLRRSKTYCKLHKVVEMTQTHVITSPIHYEDTPKLWLRFGRKNLQCKNAQSKFEYQIWENEQAFNRAVMEGYYEKT